jgi:hypothetical protein
MLPGCLRHPEQLKAHAPTLFPINFDASNGSEYPIGFVPACAHQPRLSMFG